jgi:hypothetical protein
MQFEYGYGGATITSNPSGIDCYLDCSETYAAGTTVTLSVQPWRDTEFLGWSGACTGTGTSCTVSMAADQNAVASFRFVGYIP